MGAGAGAGAGTGAGAGAGTGADAGAGAGSGSGAGAGDGPGAGAKKEDKKAISTQAVCIPPGSPSEARLVLTDGWMDGRAGKVEKNHVFSKYLKNFAIFFPSCFASP